MDPFIGHCTYLTAAAELDHSDPNTPEKLKPLQKFLAKCWALSCGAFQLHPFSFFCIPCHAPPLHLLAFKMSFHMGTQLRFFRKLVVSCRGAERQPTHCLTGAALQQAGGAG